MHALREILHAFYYYYYYYYFFFFYVLKSGCKLLQADLEERPAATLPERASS